MQEAHRGGGLGERRGARLRLASSAPGTGCRSSGPSARHDDPTKLEYTVASRRTRVRFSGRIAMAASFSTSLVHDRLIVTGGGSGIGRGVALKMAKMGATAYIV